MTLPFTHLDPTGRLHMVDVSQKAATPRMARAQAVLRTRPETAEALLAGTLPKGDAIAAARLAGILAAKQTGALIPLCHPVPLTHVDVQVTRVPEGLRIEGEARCVGPTGVEMEALVAVSVAGLTLYDMAKSVERDMTLTAVQLVEKQGGKNGPWRRDEATTG